MNQTNVVTQSTKSIPVSPYSKTPQPKTIRPAQLPLNGALDEQFSQEEPELTLEEAKELERSCQECVTKMHGTTDALRRAVYQAYVQGAPERLGMNKEEFQLKVASAGTNNIHRSTINRMCLAARMEAGLKLPFGEVKEATLRMLRTKVPKEKCGAVLKHALKKAGSYPAIEAKAIEPAARELGYLKTLADNASQAKGGEPVRDVEASCERSATSDVKAAVRRTTPQDDTTSSNVTETREEAVRVWLQEYSKHQNALQRLLKKFDIQPAQIQKVVALVKHQYQQLDDLLSEIG